MAVQDASGQVLVLSGAEVARLLPMAACVDLMGEALAAVTRGDAVLPERLGVWTPGERGLLLVMPAYLFQYPQIGSRSSLGQPAPDSKDIPGNPDAVNGSALGVKVLTLFAGNAGTPVPAIQGAVLLFDPEHGALLAIMDASAITAIRTGAVSGLATRLLARPDAGDLAILGSGVQARSHLAAMRAVRTLRRVRVWSRDPAHARQFAETESARHGLTIEAIATPRDAVEGADLICTVTSAREPVVEGAWLAPGAHVNAVGVTGDPHTRELDTAAIVRARLFVDRRAAALAEAGELLVPIAEGAISEAHIQAELGEVVMDRHPGRTSPSEITVFKSLGLAIEDVAAAQYVYARAREQGVGTSATLSGEV